MMPDVLAASMSQRELRELRELIVCVQQWESGEHLRCPWFQRRIVQSAPADASI
jgi:hypothetical protein